MRLGTSAVSWRVIREYPYERPTVGSVLIISQVPPSLGPSQTYQAVARVMSTAIPALPLGAASGETELLDRTLAWTSSNAAVFTVNSSSGLVTYVGAGTANLTASCEGVTSAAQAIICVTPPATVATVTVTPTTLAGQVGGTGILAAVVRDASSNFLANRVVTWASSDVTKVTVSADSGNDAHTVTVTYVATGGTPTVTATCETVPSSAVAVTVTAVPAPGNFRTFTTPEMAIMVGPQSVDLVYTEPGMQNLETVMTTRLNEFYNRFITQAAPLWIAQTGTISVDSAGVITGAGGADFTGKLKRGIRWIDVSRPEGYTYSQVFNPSGANCHCGGHSENTGDIVSAVNPGATVAGVAFELSTTASIPGVAVINDELYSASAGNYYDIIYGVWQHAARKGVGAAFDATILGQAREMSDAMSTLRAHLAYDCPSNTVPKGTPRGIGLASMIVRALDGKSHWFPAFRQYINQQGPINVDRFKATGVFPNEALGQMSVRDAGYMLIFSAMLGAVDPDSTQRTNYLNKAIAWCNDPFIRRQYTYGGWRIKTANNTQDPNSFEWVSDTLNGPGGLAGQPFLDVIPGLGMKMTHRAMRKAGRTGGADATDYAAIAAGIVKVADAMCLAYKNAANGFHASYQAMAYWWGAVGQYRNGTRLLVTVDTGDATYAVDPGPTAKGSLPNWNEIVLSRQLNMDSLELMSYAYWLVLNGLAAGTASKYLNQAKAQIASCFQFAPQNTTPPVYGALWNADTFKNLAQAMGIGQALKASAYLMDCDDF